MPGEEPVGGGIFVLEPGGFLTIARDAVSTNSYFGEMYNSNDTTRFSFVPLAFCMAPFP
ncbi:MAG: hypothetical protein ACRD8W_09255 [Nitrososphaeraceae archaeon]